MIFRPIECAIRHELLVISLIPATRVTSLSVLGKTMGPKVGANATNDLTTTRRPYRRVASHHFLRFQSPEIALQSEHSF